MPTLQLIITDVGRQAIVDEGALDLPVVLSQFALGSGAWSPDATATALQNEIKRIDAIGGLAISEESVQVTCTDDSGDAYTFAEFGLYTDKGVLFAIYSDPTGISDKDADVLLLVVADIALTSVPPGSVTVNEIGFSNPPATESAPGVAPIATQPIVDQGDDDGSIVTPKKLMAASSSTSQAGKLVRRDAAGNFRTNMPINDNDCPRKIDVDTVQANLTSHSGLTAPHGATVAATASRLMLRDASGRAKVAAPSASDDIARKAEVDAAKLAAMIPSGTIMLFAQTAAPTGWTKLIDQNNTALRVVSGAAGTGGSAPFSTAMANRTVSSVAASGTVGSHTLTIPEMPQHRHTMTVYDESNPGVYNSGAVDNQPAAMTQYTNYEGGNGGHVHPFTGIAHSHTLDMAVKYVDVIRAQKD